LPSFFQSIEGWFDFDDIYELALRRCGSRSAHFVEIGCYKGRSTCYLAERIRETGLDVRLDAVDTFQGDVHVGYGDLWPEFAANLEQAGVLCRVQVHRASSSAAAEIFPTACLDFVFIDAEHTAAAVARDLATWWPKVRAGGILAGHDYTNFPGVATAVDQFVAQHALAPAFRTSRSSWLIHKSLPVDGLYCINLATRPDRRERATASFRRAGILPGVEFFSAIVGTTLSHPRVISDGQAGCCASHLQVMRQAAARGQRHVLIFEDDADLVADFGTRFEATLARCPTSYDLCYLGALCHRGWGNYLHPFDDLLSRAGYVFGTHAYLVNLERLPSIEAALQDHREVIDQWYARELQARGNCYVGTPYLAYQGPSFSDVSGSYNPQPRNYSEYVWR
jgi:predicted O-methyltransferase YrrM